LKEIFPLYDVYIILKWSLHETIIPIIRDLDK
jgi:hypothetical protein